MFIFIKGDRFVKFIISVNKSLHLNISTTLAIKLKERWYSTVASRSSNDDLQRGVRRAYKGPTKGLKHRTHTVTLPGTQPL